MTSYTVSFLSLVIAYSAVHMIELPKWTTVIMALNLSSSAQVYESHQSTSSISSTDAAETHQPVSAGEEHEMPMRKRRRMDSFVKLHYCDWSGIISDQNTAPINERRAEGKSNGHWRISLKSY